MKYRPIIRSTLLPHTYSCLCCGCEVFGENNFQLCSNCVSSFPFNNGSSCKRCGCGIVGINDYCHQCSSMDIFYKRAYSSLHFQGHARRLILKMKKQRLTYLADIFSHYLAVTYLNINTDIDCVVHVPFFFESKQKFCAPLILAESFSALLNLPFFKDALIKIKNNLPQKGLNLEERIENVKACYAAGDDIVKGKTILLIDDVKTTSATLNECSRILLKAGAKEVYCLTLASVKQKPTF